MQFTINTPTSADSSIRSRLASCDEILWDAQMEFAVAMEGLGFDGVAVPSHVMIDSSPMTECFVTLAATACETENVYLYLRTVSNHFRNLTLLAKQATTLDVVSGG